MEFENGLAPSPQESSGEYIDSRPNGLLDTK